MGPLFLHERREVLPFLLLPKGFYLKLPYIDYKDYTVKSRLYSEIYVLRLLSICQLSVMNITLIKYNIDGTIDFIIYNTRPIRKRVQEVV